MPHGADDVRRDGRGNQAELGLGQAELGRQRRDRDVAGGNQADSASEAFRIGLVQDIVAPEELDGTINELLGTLMLTSAEAVAEAKRLVRDLAFRLIDDALVADTAQRIAAIRQSADGREGISSFLEKRKPRWVAEYEATQAGEDDEEM